MMAITLLGWVFAAEVIAQELDLGERVQPLPTANRFSISSYHVWCGAPVKGADERYHVFRS